MTRPSGVASWGERALHLVMEVLSLYHWKYPKFVFWLSICINTSASHFYQFIKKTAFIIYIHFLFIFHHFVFCYFTDGTLHCMFLNILCLWIFYAHLLYMVFELFLSEQAYCYSMNPFCMWIFSLYIFSIGWTRWSCFQAVQLCDFI